MSARSKLVLVTLLAIGPGLSCGGETERNERNPEAPQGGSAGGGAAGADGGVAEGGVAEGGTVQAEGGSAGVPEVLGVGGITNTACVDDTRCDTCLVHVRADGSDDNDGTSWDRALRTVQMGLDVAAVTVASDLGYSSCEVWVGAGTYLPTTLTDEADPRSAAFLLREGVGLYGGFAGTETGREARNVEQYETSLSGDLGVLEDISDNSYYVVKGANAAVLDGVTVTGGAGSRPSSTCAGLVTLGETGGPDVRMTVEGCKFVFNDGDALCNVHSRIVLADSTISNNEGAGVDLDQFAGAVMSAVTISGNRSTAVRAFRESSVDMSYSVVVDNGEGVAVGNFMAQFDISGSTIAGNQGYALEQMDSGQVSVVNSIIWGREGVDAESVIHSRSAGASVRLEHSIVQGRTIGEGVLDAEPRFVSPETGDYSLSADSPAIDAGDPCRGFSEPPLVDLFGNPRWDIAGFGSDPQGLDMGAYEFQGTAGVDTPVSEFVCGS